MTKTILGTTLYSQEDAIKEVNTSVKTIEKALTSEMLAFYRDIIGIVPKPIRIRMTNKRGGANSFYTSEGVDSLKLITYENKINKKLLKDIIKEKGEVLENNKIKSDLFRTKYDFLIKTKNNDAYIVEVKSAAGSNKKKAQQQIRHYMQAKLRETAEALNREGDESKLDVLFDDIGTLYYKRIKSRMEEKAKEENKK